MPRTVDEILAHADELAKVFEDHEPDPGNIKQAAALRDVAKAFRFLAYAEEELLSAVAVARGLGFTWAEIGRMVGTSGEAARQKYGKAA